MGDSPLISRSLLSAMAGLQFAGKRDLYEVFGYKRTLTYDDLYAKYLRQDITARIVDEPVKAIWSNPPTILNEALNKVMVELSRKFDLWQTFARADRLLAFGDYSILLLGLSGPPEKPVSRSTTATGRRELLYVQPYSSKQAKIERLVEDPTNPRFGLPEVYRVDIGTTRLNSGTTTTSSNTILVHHSRVIHLTDPLLVDNYRSAPRLEKVYNVLDDLMKVGGGSAETYWLNASRGMQVNIDKEMDLTAEDANALTDEMEEFQHQLRRYIRTRGVEIKPLSSDVTDPRGTFEVLMKLLAAATGIPQRILMGSEAGQLASEQDRANWAVQIEYRRAEFAEPYVIRPFVQKLSELGLLPATGGEEQIALEWPESFRMSPLERAQEMAQKARTIVNLSRQPLAGHPIVTTEEARRILGLNPDNSLPPVTEGVDLAWRSKGIDPETGRPLEAMEDPEDSEDSEDAESNNGTRSERELPGSDGGPSDSGPQRQNEGRRQNARLLVPLKRFF